MSRGPKPKIVVSKDAVTEVPPAPSWLSTSAKREWRRIAPILVQRRILTTADLGSLENYCCAIGQVQETERVLRKEGHTYQGESGPKRHPATAIQSDAMTRARLLAVELGLTPAHRRQAAIREDDTDDTIDPLSIS